MIDQTKSVGVAGSGFQPSPALDMADGKVSEHRRWLARQLMDERLTDEEAFGIAAYHPSVSDQRKASPSLVAAPAGWRETVEKLAGVISFDDVRLTAGEGKLTIGDVLRVVNVILAARGRDCLAASPPLPASGEGVDQ